METAKEKAEQLLGVMEKKTTPVAQAWVLVCKNAQRMVEARVMGGKAQLRQIVALGHEIHKAGL